MNKLYVVFIVFIILITALLIGSKEDNSYDNDDIWEDVVDIEFSAFNLMGESIFFYEENNTYYCDFWMSGSGVPVIFFHTSEVEFDQEGNIVMDVPSVMMGGPFISIEQTIETITVKYIDGEIHLNDVKYKEVNWSSREQALEWIGKLE